MSTPPEPATDPQAWTIGRLLNWTTDFFNERGIGAARLEAEVLLAHCRGCQRIMLYTAFDEPASEELRTRFRELVRQRASGTPVAYLVGKREFYSAEFKVTPAVLIPRPETELLVVTLLDRAKEQGRAGEKLAVADIGTGSGVLAVCAAKNLPQAQVTAIDVSPQALEIARHNGERHAVADRIEFVESDLMSGLPEAKTFDFIVSNPPYITTSELAELDRTVREFEPHVALDGGAQGTTVIERLVDQAAVRLRPGGLLLVEISPTIVERCESLVDDSPLERLATIDDLDGRPRVLQARREEPA